MNLPEGIILIKEETGQVILGNEEFKKLFQLPKDADLNQINNRVNNPILL